MKKARKFLVLFLTLAIAVSVSVTNLTLSAFAAEPVTAASVPEISVPTDLSVGKTVKASDLKGITHVRDPKGALVEIGAGYTFKQAGYYSFAVVIDGTVVYEGFRTSVSVEDVTLKVNAAKVPTYAKTGTEIKLPLATLVDKDGKTVSSGYTFAYAYTTASGTTTNVTPAADATEWSIPAADVKEAGSFFVTYTAKSAGDAATFTQHFTVQVQTDFEDKTDPSLNYSGIPSNINVRSKVTLPIATASDNFDSNVEITVSVKKVNKEPVYQMEKKGNKVEYVLDDNGEKIEAVFDNSENMSFYPDAAVDYTVTYTATDDSGNKTESSRRMTASDKLAPEIDVQTPELIPSKWAVITYNKNASPVNSFTIPVAYIYDNAALATNAETVGADADKKAVASVSIRKDNTKIFDSANAPAEDYGTFMKRNDDGSYAFTLSEFKPKNGDKIGTYTITYKATDAANLTTTKDYKFTVSGGSLTYDVIPAISYDKLPDYLVAGEDFSGFDITVDATYVDESNTASKVAVTQDFKYYYQAQGGTEFELIDLEDEDFTLPENPGKVKVVVSAADAYGNKATTNLEKVVDVIDFKSGSAVAFDLKDNATKTYEYDREVSGASYDFLSDKSTIKVSDVADENKYVGFEAYLTFRATESAQAEASKLDTEITYYKDVNGVMTLTGAKIRPTEKGFYTLVLRGFDQGNGGVVKTMTVEVTTKDTTGPSDVVKTNFNVNSKAASSSSQVNAYSAQTLNYKKASEWANCDYIEVVAKGGRFSVMDKRFVPMDTTNTYSLKYKAVGNGGTVDAGSESIVTNGVSSGDFTFKEITDQYTIKGAADDQTLTVKYEKYRAKLDMSKYLAAVDAANAETGDTRQWMLDKAMADYLFPVPQVSVINQYGSVELTVKVYAPNESSSSTPEKDSAGNLYFYNSADGEYKIEYTAKSANGESSVYPINVTSGDILKPELTVTTVPQASAKKGTTFKFSAITGTDLVTSASDLTYKRTIKFPDESVKTDSGNKASTTEYTLDQVGVYTVTYEVTDKAGNKTTKVYTIEVTEKKASSVNSQMISTVLIVVAALLIVGLLVYFFAFRKVDMDKKRKPSNDKK